MAQTATPTAQQLETAQRLRAAIGRLSRLLRPTEAGTAADLPPTRVSVLLTAERHGPIRLADVAEREGINPTMLSRTVQNLAAAGLIERSADPDDRRSAWIEATTAGRELAEQIRHQRTVAVQSAVDTLTAEDRRLLADALPALEHLAALLAEERR
jgi:DNA-binding MarR family transcriptional regulator